MSGGNLNPFKPGSIYEQIGQGVGHAVENIGKNPLPIIMAVALTAITAGAGVGLAAAELAGAEGLITAGGVVTGVEAGSTAAMISAGVNVGIANAAAAAINGGNISDIATSGLIGGLTAGAAAGLSGSDLLKAVTENMDPKTAQMITSATGRSVGGALTAVLQGKDPMTGAVSGAVTGALSSALSNGQIAELNKSVASVLGNVAGAASGAVTAGKDVATAIANSAVYGTLRSGLSSAYNNFNSAMDELKSAQEKFPELKNQVEQLTPVAQQQQAEAQATRDRLMELSQQYDTAKANNDADGMTAAANAFNALKPTFDSQLAAFNETNTKLTDLGGQLENVQTVAKNFEDANTKLQAAFGDFTTGSTKLSEEQKLVDKQIAMLPETDKQRYSELVNSGLDGKAAIDQVTKEYADRKATADAAVAELPSQAKIEYRNALLSGKDPELAVQEAKDSLLGKVLNNSKCTSW
jgi:predicted nuclease with TOPRIM domain